MCRLWSGSRRTSYCLLPIAWVRISLLLVHSSAPSGRKRRRSRGSDGQCQSANCLQAARTVRLQNIDTAFLTIFLPKVLHCLLSFTFSALLYSQTRMCNTQDNLQVEVIFINHWCSSAALRNTLNNHTDNTSFFIFFVNQNLSSTLPYFFCFLSKFLLHFNKNKETWTYTVVDIWIIVYRSFKCQSKLVIFFRKL